MSFGDIQTLAALFAELFLGIHTDRGIATRFGDPGDPWMGGNMACLHRGMEPDDMVCAHLWLPCGTQVLVTNLDRPGEAVCTIGDRGPYGVQGRSWQALIDLSPAMSNAVNLDGRDRVRLVYRIPPAKLGDRTSKATWLEQVKRKRQRPDT